MFIRVVYGHFSLTPTWCHIYSQIIILKLIKFTWLEFNIRDPSFNNHTNSIPLTSPMCFLLRKPMSKSCALLVPEVGSVNPDWHSLLLIPDMFSFRFPSRYSESLFLIAGVLQQELGHLHKKLYTKNPAHLHCIIFTDVVSAIKCMETEAYIRISILSSHFYLNGSVHVYSYHPSLLVSLNVFSKFSHSNRRVFTVFFMLQCFTMLVTEMVSSVLSQ